MKDYESYTKEQPKNYFPFWGASKGSDISVKTESTPKKKVLIVDDNIIFRSIAENHLKDAYECISAIDGEDALVKHANFNSDLILMDLLMPKLSGIEAAIEIRNRGSHVPIIAVTSTPTDEVYNTMQACIVKPYRKADLIKVINDAFEAVISKQSVLEQLKLVSSISPSKI